MWRLLLILGGSFLFYSTSSSMAILPHIQERVGEAADKDKELARYWRMTEIHWHQFGAEGWRLEFTPHKGLRVLSGIIRDLVVPTLRFSFQFETLFTMRFEAAGWKFIAVCFYCKSTSYQFGKSFLASLIIHFSMLLAALSLPFHYHSLQRAALRANYL